MTSDAQRLVLLTGATGYVGGRLLRRLEERGEHVRCLARRPEALGRLGEITEAVVGDVLDLASLRSAMRDVDSAYYLVHSMGSGESFEQRDRQAAHNFATAARAAGVRRVVYLGGLGTGDDLSSHLSSRQEVGRILTAAGPPTIEFRASIVIGSGSISFEMLRKLVERLPVMITPRWVRTAAQPIAIDDVLAYLVAALDVDVEGSAVFEIGGPTATSYEGLMREYARQVGLRRVIIPVPFLTARLSSLWLGLVTPIYARVGRKLIDSLPHETVVRDRSALRAFPIRPRGFEEAIASALRNEDRDFAETRWSDAVAAAGRDAGRYGGFRHGKRLVDSRSVTVPVPADQAFRPIRRIGGDVGWYSAAPLWRLRGFIDLLVGGVGARRGRRHPEELVPGATLDFWRVEAYEPNRLLRLTAEMKLPGRAWLQFDVERRGGSSTIRQTATFHPAGLLGTAYWYGLFPVHRWIFAGMLRGIARAALQSGVEGGPHAGGGVGADTVEDPLHDGVDEASEAAELEAGVVPDDRAAGDGVDGDGVARGEPRAARLQHDQPRRVVLDDHVAQRDVAAGEAGHDVEDRPGPDRPAVDEPRLGHAGIPDAGVREVGHVREGLRLRKAGLDRGDVAGHAGSCPGYSQRASGRATR